MRARRIGLALACGAIAWAGPEALLGPPLREAEAARDVASLLELRVDARDLPALAQALGRQRDAATLPRLKLLAAAPEVEVRRAVAFALGLTPGGAAFARARLEEEPDRGVRALLWRAIGAGGGADDVAAAVAALAGADAPAAAEALGRLAIRQVPGVQDAVPALVAALDPTRVERTHGAAFALFRIRPWTLTAADASRVAEVQRASADDAARAWLFARVAASWAPAARAAAVQRALDGPWRLERLAAVTAAEAGDLSVDRWRALRDDPDPWIRARVAERLDAAPLADAGPQAWREAAWAAPTPRERTDAAGAWLRADDEAARALLTAPDEAVAEMAAEALGADPSEGAQAALIGAMSRAAGASLQRASLDALDAQRQAGLGRPPDLAAVRGLAAGGPFGVRGPAAALLASWGEPVTLTPARPGPPGLDLSDAALADLLAWDVETSEGAFRVALDPTAAPVAVAALSGLAEAGQLDGRAFHRVVPGFVAQTGDPRGDGMGGPGWMIPDEPGAAPFGAGSVGVARAGLDTGGSQWFVTTSSQPHLAGAYTRFGEVVSGLDVVRALDTADVVRRVRVVRASALGPRAGERP